MIASNLMSQGQPGDEKTKNHKTCAQPMAAAAPYLVNQPFFAVIAAAAQQLLPLPYLQMLMLMLMPINK